MGQCRIPLFAVLNNFAKQLGNEYRLRTNMCLRVPLTALVLACAASLDTSAAVTVCSCSSSKEQQ
jgi:hypothetical protein